MPEKCLKWVERNRGIEGFLFGSDTNRSPSIVQVIIHYWTANKPDGFRVLTGYVFKSESKQD